jgi:hypothetical protein
VSELLNIKLTSSLLYDVKNYILFHDVINIFALH